MNTFKSILLFTCLLKNSSSFNSLFKNKYFFKNYFTCDKIDKECLKHKYSTYYLNSYLN